nr:hypothetical protein Iba_chr10aCG6020 [Ipomoea batatas]
MYCFSNTLSSVYLFISADIPNTRIGSVSRAVQPRKASILFSNDLIVLATISVSSRSNTIDKHLIFSIPKHEPYNPRGTEKHQKQGNFFCLLGIATKCTSSSPNNTTAVYKNEKKFIEARGMKIDQRRFLGSRDVAGIGAWFKLATNRGGNCLKNSERTAPLAVLRDMVDAYLVVGEYEILVLHCYSFQRS